MRMWMVDPELLCHQHLLGEHRELHTLVGTMAVGNSLYGYLVDGLVDPHQIQERHDALVAEFRRRGWPSGADHRTPIRQPEHFFLEADPCVDPEANIQELRRRCAACKERQDSHEATHRSA